MEKIRHGSASTTEPVRLAIGLIGVLVAAWLYLASAPAVAADLGAVLQSAMTGAKVPAMGVLVIRDRSVAGAAVRGVRRNDEAAIVRTDDVWHIGSDGKAMTVAMVARLADRGVLSWTKPLDRMLPDLAATMRPEYRSVTLVELLSHRSGLPENIGDDAALRAFMATVVGKTLTAQRLAYVTRALTDSPVGPKGHVSYSNTGLLLAAVIAERATGRPYEDLMRREVFAPLGMTHVGFGLTHRGQPMGHVAGGPAGAEDGNPDFFAPAGNMFMPLGDWALFCLDQLKGAKGEGSLLRPPTYALMQTAQPGGTAGLGWGVQDSVAGRAGPVLVHAGSDGSWYALVALFPASGNGVLVTANAGPDMGDDTAARAVFKAVVEDLAPLAAGAAAAAHP